MKQFLVILLVAMVIVAGAKGIIIPIPGIVPVGGLLGGGGLLGTGIGLAQYRANILEQQVFGTLYGSVAAPENAISITSSLAKPEQITSQNELWSNWLLGIRRGSPLNIAAQRAVARNQEISLARLLM